MKAATAGDAALTVLLVAGVVIGTLAAFAGWISFLLS